MSDLIPGEVRDTAMSLKLRMLLNMEMRSCKLMKPEDRYDYSYIKEVNRNLIDGKISPDEAIDKIWKWVQNEGQGTNFDAIKFWQFAKTYGRKLAMK